MIRETLPILKLYKTLIFIGMVVAPIYWLMFTDDGKRRTDTMVLWLAGGTSIDLNFKVLDAHFRPADWKSVYPKVEWQCQDADASLGNTICYGEIASYNGIPAKYLSVFFNQEVTTAVKLVYRDQYHNEIGFDVVEQLGNPTGADSVSDGFAESNNILQWRTENGLILLKRTLERGEEATLMWLAQDDVNSAIIRPEPATNQKLIVPTEQTNSVLN